MLELVRFGIGIGTAWPGGGMAMRIWVSGISWVDAGRDVC